MEERRKDGTLKETVDLMDVETEIARNVRWLEALKQTIM